ncbi:MAG TPA: GAF domain-containing protein, partial [Desulfobulbus sp.]|nr:GAF domain-containing protein [Desulfobulbus sp.]
MDNSAQITAATGEFLWKDSWSKIRSNRKYLLLLAGIPLLLTLFFSWSAFHYGTPGFRVDKTQHGLHVSTVFQPHSPVRVGDLIIAVNNEPYTQILGHLLLKPISFRQYPNSITVQRNGETLTVIPVLHSVSWSRYLLIAWPHLLLIALFLLLGILALLCASPEEPAGLFFFLLCWFATTIATTLPSHFGLLQPEIISLSFLAITLSNWLAFAGLAHFTCRFPRERDLCARRPWLPVLLYCMPPLLALVPTLYAAGINSDFFSELQRFRNLGVPVIILGAFVKHLSDLRYLQSPFAKNQVKLTVSAYWLSFAPYFFLYLIPNLLYDRPLISFRIVLLTGTILPAAYLVALLRYRLLGVDRLISRTLAYFITIGLLTLSYALLLALIKRWFFGRHIVSEELFLLYLLAIAFTINPLINHVQRLIDRAFFRYRPSDNSLLFQFSRKLAATLQFEELISLITDELPDLLQITQSAILLLDNTSSRLYPKELALDVFTTGAGRIIQQFNRGAHVLFSHERQAEPQLNRELRQLRQQGVNLALPLSGDTTSLSGILLLGPRKDGGLFREDDIRLLATLANQITIALKNSLHYTSMIESKQQLEILFSKVVQTEKMAALGEMSATLAHEIKNPLGIIRSSAQYLAEAKRPDEITQEMLSYIIDEVDGLNLILSNILGLAKFKDPNFRSIELQKELPLLCDQWRHSDDHNPDIHIHCRVKDHLPLFYGDMQQLRQVLLNLLRNSEDALAGPGNIF